MKYRSYSITIQNVKPQESYKWLEEYATNRQVKEYSYSVEPYNHQEGYHIHLFVQYHTQRHFTALHKEMNNHKNKFLQTRPEDETRDWGRVHIEVQKGKLEECEAYLKGETKSKALGEVFTGRTKICWRRHRYIQNKDVGKVPKKGMLEEFCGRCQRNSCKGCCPGCLFCDQNDHFYQNNMMPEYQFCEVVKSQENALNRARKKYKIY